MRKLLWLLGGKLTDMIALMRKLRVSCKKLLIRSFASRTVIAIVHRFSYIDRFDRVAALLEGELVECDEPRALVDRNSRFKELYLASLKDK
jgi:ABC-type multidrug transport system fused ATPase/permease subunit